MFSINTNELHYIEVKKRARPRSLSPYSDRDNSRFVKIEGVLLKGFLYSILVHTGLVLKRLV